MKNWLLPLGIGACVILAGIIYFTTGSALLALLLALGGMLLAVVGHPITGHVPRRRSDTDAKAIKQHQEENPGATVGDAIEVLSRQE